MCVIVWPPLHQQECALTAKKCRYTHYLHTHEKHTHIFSHCASPHLTPTLRSISHDHTKSAPTFRRGAIIIVDDINYFSTLLFCAIYALFASFAALLASRLVLRKSMYFFSSAVTRLPSLSYATKSTEPSV